MAKIISNVDTIDIDNFYIAQVNNLIAAGRYDVVRELAADFSRVKTQRRRQCRSRRAS